MRANPRLLTVSTFALLLALAPISVAQAQSITPELKAAFAAFQKNHDADSQQKLQDACVAAGFQGIDDCVSALTGQAPLKEETPPPASKEAPPPPSAEAPPPAAPSQEAAPPPASSEEAPPPKKPTKKPPKATPPSSEEAAPAAPASEASPPPPSQEAAPAAPSQETAPAAPSQEAAPAPSSDEAPAAPAASKQALQKAVKAYNAGVAKLDKGDAKGQADVTKAKGQIDKICQDGGFADTDACLAQFGLTLNPLPPPPAAATSSEAAPPPAPPASSEQPAPPAASSEQPAPPPAQASSEQPATASSEEQPPVTAPKAQAPSSSEEPISQMPQASEQVDQNAVEVLPPEVKPQEAAPILDSVKDADNGSSSSEQPAPPPATPPAPPPKDDKQAQQDIKPPPEKDQSTQTDKPQKTIDPGSFSLTPVAPPDSGIKVIDFGQRPNGPNGPGQNGPGQNGPGPKGPGNGNGNGNGQNGNGPNGNGPNGNGPNGPKPPGGNQPPQGAIFQIGINIFINNPEQERDRFYNPRQDKISYEQLSRGRVRETIVRRDGSRVVTIRDQYGDVLQRSKILPGGREIILSSYDPDDQDISDWHDPGDDLPPLRLNIPADQYILDADTSDDDQVYDFLNQPPVEQVKRIYTIDEVKRSARLRDSVRRLEVGNLTFDTGQATISRDQVGALQGVADAMLKMLQANPGETFLIEGHTDAVGSDVSNLVLSDQRAATVARILTDFYAIPPENLVTQGYGERFLKVKTDQSEPLNRRVTIKRITPLITYASN